MYRVPFELQKKREWKFECNAQQSTCFQFQKTPQRKESKITFLLSLSKCNFSLLASAILRSCQLCACIEVLKTTTENILKTIINQSARVFLGLFSKSTVLAQGLLHNFQCSICRDKDEQTERKHLYRGDITRRREYMNFIFEW